MKKIFLDTNFVIDYFFRQEYRDQAERVIALGFEYDYRFYISYLTVANLAYIMRKTPRDRLYSVIENICELFSIVTNDKKQILRNLEIHANDFEDGLQYQSALESKCDCIISRNTTDFTFSSISVYSPAEFVEKYGK